MTSREHLPKSAAVKGISAEFLLCHNANDDLENTSTSRLCSYLSRRHGEDFFSIVDKESQDKQPDRRPNFHLF